MREIKFRAWFKHGNIKGMLYDKMPGDCLVWKNQGQAIENVMQYTGLVDKNGREIYEGDILLGVKDYKKKPLHVWWDEEQCFYHLSLINSFNVKKITKNNVIKAEIIGNIYENPELLEGDLN